jgi:hypothetical protein
MCTVKRGDTSRREDVPAAATAAAAVPVPIPDGGSWYGVMTAVCSTLSVQQQEPIVLLDLKCLWQVSDAGSRVERETLPNTDETEGRDVQTCISPAGTFAQMIRLTLPV